MTVSTVIGVSLGVMTFVPEPLVDAAPDLAVGLALLVAGVLLVRQLRRASGGRTRLGPPARTDRGPVSLAAGLDGWAAGVVPGEGSEAPHGPRLAFVEDHLGGGMSRPVQAPAPTPTVHDGLGHAPLFSAPPRLPVAPPSPPVPEPRQRRDDYVPPRLPDVFVDLPVDEGSGQA